MTGTLDFDVGEFLDKAFITFRKTKNINETMYSLRYNFLNLITKHYTRNTNDIYAEVIVLLLKNNIVHECGLTQENILSKTKCHLEH